MVATHRLRSALEQTHDKYIALWRPTNGSDRSAQVAHEVFKVPKQAERFEKSARMPRQSPVSAACLIRCKGVDVTHLAPKRWQNASMPSWKIMVVAIVANSTDTP